MIRPIVSGVWFILLQKMVSAVPQVCVPNMGCARGVEITYKRDKYDAFMGIPYAKKPINELRFANPVPERRWPADLDATKPKPDCIQKNYYLKPPAISGDEDCLYLNIYRPKERLFESLAVMVFIHGGGLFCGSANPRILGPEYFMQSRKVLLVTFSYRLGPFGFLGTCDENIPGNMGLKDQRLVLEWVNQFISAFNGNPRDITLFGHGSGGAAVQLHMLSKQSRDLFQKAIVMSGSAASPNMNVDPDPLLQARKLARYVGMRDAHYIQKAELVKYLRNASAVNILNAVDDFKLWDVDPLVIFRPVIEFPSEEAFLTEEPKYTIASGQHKKITWMVGFVPQEGGERGLAIATNYSLRIQFNFRFEERLVTLMQIPPSDLTYRNIYVLKRHYFEDLFYDLFEITDANQISFLDAIGERIYLHPFIKTLEQYTSKSNFYTAPVYIYKFNYRGPKSYSNIYSGKLLDYGVVHKDDLLYLFRSPALFPDFRPLSTDSMVVKEMIDIFTTFATTGKPKHSENLRPCTSRDMVPYDRICDYIEITNRGTSFVAKTENVFNKTGIRFWDRIVELFDGCFY